MLILRDIGPQLVQNNESFCENEQTLEPKYKEPVPSTPPHDSSAQLTLTPQGRSPIAEVVEVLQKSLESHREKSENAINIERFPMDDHNNKINTHEFVRQRVEDEESIKETPERTQETDCLKKRDVLLSPELSHEFKIESKDRENIQLSEAESENRMLQRKIKTLENEVEDLQRKLFDITMMHSGGEPLPSSFTATASSSSSSSSSSSASVSSSSFSTEAGEDPTQNATTAPSSSLAGPSGTQPFSSQAAFSADPQNELQRAHLRIDALSALVTAAEERAATAEAKQKSAELEAAAALQWIQRGTALEVENSGLKDEKRLLEEEIQRCKDNLMHERELTRQLKSKVEEATGAGMNFGGGEEDGEGGGGGSGGGGGGDTTTAMKAALHAAAQVKELRSTLQKEEELRIRLEEDVEEEKVKAQIAETRLATANAHFESANAECMRLFAEAQENKQQIVALRKALEDERAAKTSAGEEKQKLEEEAAELKAELAQAQRQLAETKESLGKAMEVIGQSPKKVNKRRSSHARKKSDNETANELDETRKEEENEEDLDDDGDDVSDGSLNSESSDDLSFNEESFNALQQRLKKAKGINRHLKELMEAKEREAEVNLKALKIQMEAERRSLAAWKTSPADVQKQKDEEMQLVVQSLKQSIQQTAEEASLIRTSFYNLGLELLFRHQKESGSKGSSKDKPERAEKDAALLKMQSAISQSSEAEHEDRDEPRSSSDEALRQYSPGIAFVQDLNASISFVGQTFSGGDDLSATFRSQSSLTPSVSFAQSAPQPSAMPPSFPSEQPRFFTSPSDPPAPMQPQHSYAHPQSQKRQTSQSSSIQLIFPSSSSSSSSHQPPSSSLSASTAQLSRLPHHSPSSSFPSSISAPRTNQTKSTPLSSSHRFSPSPFSQLPSHQTSKPTTSTTFNQSLPSRHFISK
ncbi:uncharacterized protein MONOS_6678 [Monocercomonoides exilis]|uniref:uncharacterized protein n=1 Tax=Monocercomonoides exilis TaxID=2049356 RepID=UPI00355A54ED|nr:hypothetical protein MONOS_6678 [Monocercomonoides exilis]|eukprot:MONOS_6678.1-p1 / transcript=MONOS_6678.1 / gene=MONOS_6678 / organism=Monocercomonoides_exilis_PA203 / gene_product=unspecified product / transcript_product=unspecified product / location=Mono_scaffold00214:86023-88899(-) / protein_length=927 / sequence_SO=supercontig / SO=protein_coding / is_pseudo=false